MTSPRAIFPFALSLALASFAPSPALAVEAGEVLSEEAATVTEEPNEEGATYAEQPEQPESATYTGDEPEAGGEVAGGDAEAQQERADDALQVAVAGVEAAVREFDPESQSALYAVGLGVCAGVGVGACFTRGVNVWGTVSERVNHD